MAGNNLQLANKGVQGAARCVSCVSLLTAHKFIKLIRCRISERHGIWLPSCTAQVPTRQDVHQASSSIPWRYLASLAQHGIHVGRTKRRGTTTEVVGLTSANGRDYANWYAEQVAAWSRTAEDPHPGTKEFPKGPCPACGAMTREKPESEARSSACMGTDGRSEPFCGSTDR